MKEGIEAVVAIVGIMSAVGGFILWIVRHLEKKAAEREAAKQMAAQIKDKLLHLEANYGRLMEEREEFRKEVRQENQRLKEELEDVRKDFAQFVQQLFFKK